MIERGPLAGPTGVRLGVRAPTPGPGAVQLAVGHAIEALRAGVPVVTTPAAVGADELVGFGGLYLARRWRPRAWWLGAAAAATM